MLTYGSLFAGIGGFDLGFERARIRTVWQVEIDPYCRAVLAHHFPHAKRFADVRDCGAYNLSDVDVITGGFPCQPVSCAGKRRGTADDRWLWPEMLRIVSVLKPAWVVAENVRGLLTLEGGVVFEQVLLDLEGEGYDVQPLVIPACAVDAPHRRNRVWILAHARGPRNVGESRNGAGEGASGTAKREELWAEHNDQARHCREALADTAQQRGQRWPMGTRQAEPQGPYEEVAGLCRWEPEPDVGRVADGVPHRVDRLACLGNAVVPQIAEFIGQMIVEAESRAQEGKG